MSSSRRDKGKGRDYDRPPVQTKDVPWYNRWPTPYREGNDPSASGYENPVPSSQATDPYDSQMTDAPSPSSFIYGAQPSSYQSSDAGPSGSQAYGAQASTSSTYSYQDNVSQSPSYQSSDAGPSNSQTYGAQASGSSSHDYQSNVSQPPPFQGSFSGPSTSQPSGKEYTRYPPRTQRLMVAEQRHCLECGAPAATYPFSIFCTFHKERNVPRRTESMGPPPTNHCIVCNGPAHGLSVVCDEHNDKSFLTFDELQILRKEYGGCESCGLVRVDRGKHYCNGCQDRKNGVRREAAGNSKRQGLCTRCRKPTNTAPTCDECVKRRKERDAKRKNARR